MTVAGKVPKQRPPTSERSASSPRGGPWMSEMEACRERLIEHWCLCAVGTDLCSVVLCRSSRYWIRERGKRGAHQTKIMGQPKH